MKRKTQNILLLAFCIGLNLTFAFYNFDITAAQIAKPTTGTQKVFSPSPPTNVSPSPSPSEEDDVIEIKTELVNLNVRVVDRNNRSISSLSKNDFKVYENNVLQPIEFFSKGEVPTNYSMVIDNSGSLRFQLEKVIEASKIIVATNRPDDETSIIRFVSRDKISIEQDFTPDKTELNDALENLYIEGGQTAIIDAVYLAAQRVTDYEKTRDPNDRKRRALILVSDGEDRDSYYKEQQLYDLLRETDVQIYAIGFVSELSKEGGFISKSPQGKAKAFLERLAAETGGKVYFPNSVDELSGIAQDIAKELRTQYLIGYLPPNDVPDGSFRSIKVVVDDGPKKEKRIAITRSGITRSKDNDNKPVFQNKNPK